jgi:hypothetical protein
LGCGLSQGLLFLGRAEGPVACMLGLGFWIGLR